MNKDSNELVVKGMFPIADKRFSFLALFQAVLLICLLFVLTSCGDDACYFDLKLDKDAKGSRNVTKSVSIDPKEDDPAPVAMISSKSGDEGTATIAVSGFVSMCADRNTGVDVNSNMISMCKGDTVIIKHLCPQTVTQDNFKDKFSQCTIPALLDNIGAPAPLCKERGLCDSNGIGYRFVRKEGEEKEVLEAYGDCKELQGDQTLDCDTSGNETVIFHNDTKSVKAVPVRTGRPCPTKRISANYSGWTELEQDILPGDIVSMKIDKPDDGIPNFLALNANYNYPNTYNTAINRWVQDRSRYAKAFRLGDCPQQLKFDVSGSELSELKRQYPKCSVLFNTDIISDDSNKLSLWNQSGKGLVLSIGREYQRNYFEKAWDCQLPSMPSDAIAFNSDSNKTVHDNFGLLEKVTREDIKNQVVVRTFIPTKKFPKICSKILDIRPNDPYGQYKNNLGGYVVNVSKTSCVAVNGNPSPCCNDFRGALEYKLGTADWKPFSTTAKFVSSGDDTGSDSFQVVNNGEKAEPLYLRVRSAQRANASGAYLVKVSYKEYADGGVSRIIEDIKDVLKYMFFGDPKKPGDKGLLAKFFSNIAGNGQYLQYIRILLLLYIILYGLAFLLGHVQISQKDLIIRTLKIGVVLTLIDKQGYSFLYDNFFRLFIDGPDALICKSSFVSDCTPGKATFGFIDVPFALLFFNAPTWLKLLALSVTSPLGTVLVGLLIVGLFYFIVGVMTGVVSYLMCIMAIGVLILISPVFIPFMLFEKTNNLFRKWLDLLVRYALEPVLLIIGLQVLVSIFYAIFRELLNFTVCWKCVWPLDLSAISSVGRFIKAMGITTTVFCIPFFGPFGLYGGGGVTFGSLGILLPSVILLVILSYLIKDYHSFISTMMDQFTGVMRPTAFSGGGEVSFFRNKFKINAVENWVGKQMRKGVRATTGIHFKTPEERRKEQAEKDEAAKRKGLSWMHRNKIPFSIDRDARKLKNTLNALSKDTVDTLRNGGADGDKAAFELGNTMFKNLSADKHAYEGFVNGMKSLRAMDAEDIARLVKAKPNLKGLEELHKVLNSQAVNNSFNELTIKTVGEPTTRDVEIKAAAMRRIGGSMFMNKELADSLLNDKTNGELSEKIFELGRSSRSKIR
jgi:type IV secretory pathway VirB6-like protein